MPLTLRAAVLLGDDWVVCELGRITDGSNRAIIRKKNSYLMSKVRARVK
jgi:hypothetical protein